MAREPNPTKPPPGEPVGSSYSWPCRALVGDYGEPRLDLRPGRRQYGPKEGPGFAVSKRGSFLRQDILFATIENTRVDNIKHTSLFHILVRLPFTSLFGGKIKGAYF